MQESIFYRLDPLLICPVLMVFLVATSEIGFWVKTRMARDGPDTIGKADIALIIGAVLTLLALLLGFTYSMSEGRFEERRQLVIDEANAIGTTYLRAKTLPEPRSSEIQELLRQYTALRVEIAGKMGDDPEKIPELYNREKKLQRMLWSHAAALARETPNPVISAFLVPLNEMIDLQTKRVAAFRNRVPFPIYVVLLIVSAVALWLIGYYLVSVYKPLFFRRGRRVRAFFPVLCHCIKKGEQFRWPPRQYFRFFGAPLHSCFSFRVLPQLLRLRQQLR